jgi:hypothetical protein
MINLASLAKQRWDLLTPTYTDPETGKNKGFSRDNIMDIGEEFADVLNITRILAERLSADPSIPFDKALLLLTRVGMVMSRFQELLAEFDDLLPDSYRQEDVDRAVTRQECKVVQIARV